MQSQLKLQPFNTRLCCGKREKASLPQPRGQRGCRKAAGEVSPCTRRDQLGWPQHPIANAATSPWDKRLCKGMENQSVPAGSWGRSLFYTGWTSSGGAGVKSLTHPSVQCGKLGHEQTLCLPSQMQPSPSTDGHPGSVVPPCLPTPSLSQPRIIRSGGSCRFWAAASFMLSLPDLKEESLVPAECL